MKKILIAFMILFMFPIAFGELQNIDTEMEIEIANESIKLITEDGTYNYACGGNHDHDITLSLKKNLSCNTDELLEDTNDKLEDIYYSVNVSAKYYDKYLECYGLYTTCNNKLAEANSTEDIVNKYINTYEQLQDCEDTKSSFSAKASRAEADLETCEKDIKEMEDGRIWWGIIGVGVGIGIAYMLWKKPKGPVQSSAEKQLPTSR